MSIEPAFALDLFATGLHFAACVVRLIIELWWSFGGACNLLGTPFPVVPESETVGNCHVLSVSWVPDKSVEAKC